MVQPQGNLGRKWTGATNRNYVAGDCSTEHQVRDFDDGRLTKGLQVRRQRGVIIHRPFLFGRCSGSK